MSNQFTNIINGVFHIFIIKPIKNKESMFSLVIDKRPFFCHNVLHGVLAKQLELIEIVSLMMMVFIMVLFESGRYGWRMYGNGIGMFGGFLRQPEMFLYQYWRRTKTLERVIKNDTV
jgi:hypothetical protein